MENEKRDRYFKRFMRVVGRRPDQVMRYARHSQPLRPSDHVKLASDIPNCEMCGGKRSFELQLMPHLLSLMDVDSLKASIDWATVCVYTCAASCDTSKKGFAQEFLTKQDFMVVDKQ
jgi:pre-rRNA-processing protein TSR4